MIGLKGSNFAGLMGVTLEWLLGSLVKIGLCDNSFQMIGPKGLKFLEFDGSHPAED